MESESVSREYQARISTVGRLYAHEESKKPIRSKVTSHDLSDFSNAEEFAALSPEDKEKVWQYYNRKIPFSETRPLDSHKRARFERTRRRSVGRPKIGQGAKVVAVTLEKGFLNRVDAYAKKHKIKRAQMITQGLRIIMGETAA